MFHLPLHGFAQNPINYHDFLVVYLPLWKIWLRQLGWWNSQYMGKKCSKTPTSCHDFPWKLPFCAPYPVLRETLFCHRQHRHHSCRVTLGPVRVHSSIPSSSCSAVLFYQSLCPRIGWRFQAHKLETGSSKLSGKLQSASNSITVFSNLGKGKVFGKLNEEPRRWVFASHTEVTRNHLLILLCTPNALA